MAVTHPEDEVAFDARTEVVMQVNQLLSAVLEARDGCKLPSRRWRRAMKLIEEATELIEQPRVRMRRSA